MVNAGDKPRYVKNRLTKKLERFIQLRENLFERVYPIKPQLAQKLIDNGYLHYSKFGKFCPVSVCFSFRSKLTLIFFIFLQLFNGNCFPPVYETEKNIRTVLYRKNIYYLADEEAKNEFIKNPLKYVRQPPPKSLIPAKIAVVGPPKSGKTTGFQKTKTKFDRTFSSFLVVKRLLKEIGCVRISLVRRSKNRKNHREKFLLCFTGRRHSFRFGKTTSNSFRKWITKSSSQRSRSSGWNGRSMFRNHFDERQMSNSRVKKKRTKNKRQTFSFLDLFSMVFHWRKNTSNYFQKKELFRLNFSNWNAIWPNRFDERWPIELIRSKNEKNSTFVFFFKLFFSVDNIPRPIVLKQFRFVTPFIKMKSLQLRNGTSTNIKIGCRSTEKIIDGSFGIKLLKKRPMSPRKFKITSKENRWIKPHQLLIFAFCHKNC